MPHMKSLGVILFLFLAGACDSSNPGLRPERPTKRSDISGVTTAQGDIVVFGGDDGPIVNQIPMAQYRGDTWVFERGVGWRESTAASAPSARGRYSTTYDPANQSMFLFGGRWRQSGTTGNYTLYNDLWSYDMATDSWAVVDDGAGTAPSARYFSALAYDDASQTLYMYGGGTNVSGLNLTPNGEVWARDAGGWRQVTPTGTPPSTRLFVGYTFDSSRNRLIVYGGQIGDFVSPALPDLYALDMNTNAWSLLHDGSGTAPQQRFSGMMTYDTAGDRYLLSGGHADFQLTNDVWAFDPNNNTWTELSRGDTLTGNPLGCNGNPQEIPANYLDQDLASPQGRSGGVFAVADGQAYLFGGESDCNDHLDDTWVFRLNTSTWEELQVAGSGESCARRDDACTCLCL